MATRYSPPFFWLLVILSFVYMHDCEVSTMNSQVVSGVALKCHELGMPVLMVDEAAVRNYTSTSRSSSGQECAFDDCNRIGIFADLLEV
jgi:hypothetical protein